MKKLSRKEVFNLILESLNEEINEQSEDGDNSSLKFGEITIPDVVGKKIMDGFFGEDTALSQHYYKKLKGERGNLDDQKIVLETLKVDFERLRKAFDSNNESKIT